MARFSEDTEAYFIGTLDEINVGLVEANKLKIALKTSIEGSEFQDAILLNGKLKMKLSMMIQKLEKMGVSISNAVRIETFSGFRPLVFSGEKDVAKSDSGSDLIRSVLENKRNVREVIERLKPKAKNG